MTISASLSHFLIILNCSSNFAIYGAKVSNIHIFSIASLSHFHLLNMRKTQNFGNLSWTRSSLSSLSSSTSSSSSSSSSSSWKGPKIPGILPEHSELWSHLLRPLSVSSLLAGEFYLKSSFWQMFCFSLKLSLIWFDWFWSAWSLINDQVLAAGRRCSMASLLTRSVKLSQIWRFLLL